MSATLRNTRRRCQHSVVRHHPGATFGPGYFSDPVLLPAGTLCRLCGQCGAQFLVPTLDLNPGSAPDGDAQLRAPALFTEFADCLGASIICSAGNEILPGRRVMKQGIYPRKMTVKPFFVCGSDLRGLAILEPDRVGKIMVPPGRGAYRLNLRGVLPPSILGSGHQTRLNVYTVAADAQIGLAFVKPGGHHCGQTKRRQRTQDDRKRAPSRLRLRCQDERHKGRGRADDARNDPKKPEACRTRTTKLKCVSGANRVQVRTAE
jgi:hypothetical protein